jgi:hypothetical protein
VGIEMAGSIEWRENFIYTPLTKPQNCRCLEDDTEQPFADRVREWMAAD